MSLWDSLKVSEGVTDKLLRLVSEPILEPPWVDVGDAAIFWLKPEEEQ